MARLLRTDRAARTAALQTEVATLRATVAALRADLHTSRAEAVLMAAAADAARARVAEGAVELARSRTLVSLELPLVTVDSLQRAAAPVPMPLDLGPDTASTEIVLTERATLPEADLLDPVADRDELLDPVAALPAERAGATAATEPAGTTGAAGAAGTAEPQHRAIA
jgi:hypothetical protein